jgi:hypothetical protein
MRCGYSFHMVAGRSSNRFVRAGLDCAGAALVVFTRPRPTHPLSFRLDCRLDCFALINWWIVPTVARGGAAIGVSFFVGAALGVVAVALIALIHGFMVALSALVWSTRGDIATVRRGLCLAVRAAVGVA